LNKNVYFFGILPKLDFLGFFLTEEVVKLENVSLRGNSKMAECSKMVPILLQPKFSQSEEIPVA
jgi:hypothetical protein